MARQELIRQIAEKWSEMGVPYQVGGSADLTVHTEFLDAAWRSGTKKISYEASVFADEAASTVYMYEKTIESGQGLSFGSDEEASFQSGKTLFRKIKSVQSGPDGMAYEIDLDLGAIPRVVKETAKRSGWSFKTVLSLGKASYPPGYTGIPVADLQQQPRFCSSCGSQLSPDMRFCSSCGYAVKNQAPAAPLRSAPVEAGKPLIPVVPIAPAASQASGSPAAPVAPQASGAPAAPAASQAPEVGRKGKSRFSTAAFAGLAAVTVLLFLVSSVSPVGWIIGILILAGAFLLNSKRASRGCLTSIILWVMTAVLLLLVLVFTTPSEDAPKAGSPSSSASAASSLANVQTASAAGAASTTSGAKAAVSVPEITVAYLYTDFAKNTTSLMEVNSRTQKTSQLFAHSNINSISISDKVYALVDNRLASISQGQASFLVKPETYVVRYAMKGGSIYFGKDNTNASDNYFERLAMISTSGQNDHDLHEMGIGQLLVDDAVYFKPNSGSEVQSLLRLNLDGTGKSAIYKGSVSHLVKSRSYLYFIDFSQNSSLMRMKPDGSDVKKMADGPFKFEMAVPSQFNGLYTLAALGDTLYYINPKDGNRLYRLDDSGNTRVSDTALGLIKAVPTGDALVVSYARSSNKPGLFIWSTTGQELAKLAGEPVTEFVIR